ncbi:hypothetical protein [Paraburkholderia sp. CNPSo 3274]|nr:hypothetical protein [Paraburkholderia sp. CNPSo 3274]
MFVSVMRGTDDARAGGPDGGLFRSLDRVGIVLPASASRHARNL